MYYLHSYWAYNSHTTADKLALIKALLSSPVPAQLCPLVPDLNLIYTILHSSKAFLASRSDLTADFSISENT